MKSIVFHAVVSNEQLATLISYASNNNIQLSLMEVGTEPAKKATPFNNQMIGIVADRFGLSVCYISQWLSDNNVTSVEEAIEKTSINGMADFLREAFLDVE